MSRLSELPHWLWLETQLGAPPFIQSTVIPTLHKGKEFTRMLAQPYVSLYELKGQNQAGPLTVTYGGVAYAKPLLKSLLFVQEPVEREIGRVPVWNLGERHLSTNTDLTIIESSKYLIRRLPNTNAITLPFRVQFILDLNGEWEDVERRFRKDARRNDVRKAQKLGYEYEISHQEADVEMFYHNMYLPTMQKRHGALADLLPKREAHQLLRHGSLFLTKRDGAYVAGGLCIVREGILEFREMGVLGGDNQLMREGAVGAMNYLRIRWAHKEKYRGVNFGDCWPYFSGISSSKRKWGAAVSIPSHEHKRIWIRIQRNTPAVSQFLMSNPCSVVGNKGELQALIVTDAPGNVTPEAEAVWKKRYATPGLSGFHICSVTDLMGKSVF